MIFRKTILGKKFLFIGFPEGSYLCGVLEEMNEMGAVGEILEQWLKSYEDSGKNIPEEFVVICPCCYQDDLKEAAGTNIAADIKKGVLKKENICYLAINGVAAAHMQGPYIYYNPVMLEADADKFGEPVYIAALLHEMIHAVEEAVAPETKVIADGDRNLLESMLLENVIAEEDKRKFVDLQKFYEGKLDYQQPKAGDDKHDQEKLTTLVEVMVFMTLKCVGLSDDTLTNFQNVLSNCLKESERS